jgi:hypothetical protein
MVDVVLTLLDDRLIHPLGHQLVLETGALIHFLTPSPPLVFHPTSVYIHISPIPHEQLGNATGSSWPHLVS